MEIEINLRKIPKITKSAINSMLRKNGCGWITKLVINTEQTDPVKIDHEDYGFATYSGKFFRHVTTTPYWGSGHYSGAKNDVILSASEAARLHITEEAK